MFPPDGLIAFRLLDVFFTVKCFDEFIDVKSVFLQREVIQRRWTPQVDPAQPSQSAPGGRLWDT
jgi:hypothetical protein